MDYELEIAKLHFQSKTNKTDTCWLWMGTMFQHGYGSFNYKKKHALAHRIAYFFYTGVMPTGIIRHTCDVKACVNPTHLIDGTQAENNADTRERGRTNPARGERNGQAKLTNAQVLALREEHKEKGTSSAEIAKRLGMNQGCVWRMLNRKTYCDV
jgi:hypothetical protein